MSAARDIIGRFFNGESDFESLRDGLASLSGQEPSERDFLHKSLDALRRVEKLNDAQCDELLAILGYESPVSGTEDEPSQGDDNDRDATLFLDASVLTNDTELSEFPAQGDENDGGLTGDTLREGGAIGASSSTSRPTRTPTSSRDLTSERSTRGGGWSNLEYNADRPIPIVGDALKDRFVLAKMIGQGGMGLVFKALDLRKEEARDRDPYLALKILSEEFKKHPDSLIALQREARKSQNLAHPNVVNVFDFDRDGDTVYMTMEFLDGLPLDLLIERRAAAPITPEDALEYIRQMSAGLAYAHARGVVHSDFKPANVFLTDDGAIKILDFGIARATKNVGKKASDNTVFDAKTLGALTPAYASLDMLIGAEPRPSDDIYALGCTAYELLSGRHPYGKKPANKAYALGMAPEPLTNISRSQWRAIASALAFTREERIASVEEFVKQLDENWARKWGLHLATGVAAATIVLAVGLSIPGQLKEQELRALDEEFASGETTRVFGALEDLALLEETDQRTVLAGASNNLLRFFEGRASAAFAPQEERYDFLTAQAAFKRALSLYAFNDAAVQVVRSRLDALTTSKNQLLNSFDAQFNDSLAAFEAGDYAAADALFEVLGKVEQVDPEHPLLSDGRLSPAFAGVARGAVDSGDYDQARALLNAIMPRFPNETTLREELGRADLEERRVTQAVEVFLLEAEVAGSRSSVSSVEDLPVLGEAADKLAEIDPGNSELKLARRRASVVVAGAVDGRLEDFRFADAQQLLAENATYMEVGSIEELTSRISASIAARETSLNTLMADLRRSAAEGDIGEGSGAATALAALEAARVNTAQMNQARAILFEAYIQKSNTLRSSGEWDAALAAVTEAYSQVRSGEDAQRLADTAAQIERARVETQLAIDGSDRESHEQKRQSEIDRLGTQFLAAIEDADLQLVDVRSALDIIERLAAIDPGNSIVTGGRETIAMRLVQRAAPLRDARQYEAARQVVIQGLSVLPASERLSDELIAIAAQERLAETQAREQQIAGIRGEIEGLLEAPALDADWDGQLRSRLEALEAAGAVNAQESAELRQQIAATFADAAVAARQESRFADARVLIDSGRSYKDDYPRWSSELSLIKQGEDELLRRTEIQAQTARVDGLKQTLSTQAMALDVTAARETLARLQEIAPDDSFVTSAAPAQLANAYLSLADLALQQVDFERAELMASNGLQFDASNPDLRRISDIARRELMKLAIVEALGGATEQPPEEIAETLASIRELAGATFPRDVGFMTGQIAKRLGELAKTDPNGAKALLAQANSYFPGARALVELDL